MEGRTNLAYVSEVVARDKVVPARGGTPQIRTLAAPKILTSKAKVPEETARSITICATMYHVSL